MIIACDFDGTLSLNTRWPFIGKPNIPLIKALIKCRERGDKVILWTCREADSFLYEAIDWCERYGLIFDAVNENLPEIDFYSRKVVADVYIDDLALNVRSVAFLNSKDYIDFIDNFNHDLSRTTP